jgi:2-dehydro-3-deoxyphosphogluconate aldolase/(4S)-4-hydroxy-2-oxoglutarate aldolase
MKQVPGAIVGAGTVLNPAQLQASIDAGSEFIVSPGLTPALGEAVKADIPFLPGTANAADIMLGMDLGLSRFKFFPAEASGGIRRSRPSPRPSARRASAPPAASRWPRRPTISRSKPCCASAAAGCCPRAPLTAARSTPAAICRRPRRCGLKAALKGLTPILSATTIAGGIHRRAPFRGCPDLAPDPDNTFQRLCEARIFHPPQRGEA